MKINSIIRTYWTTMEDVIESSKSKRAKTGIFSESFKFNQTMNDNVAVLW